MRRFQLKSRSGLMFDFWCNRPIFKQMFAPFEKFVLQVFAVFVHFYHNVLQGRVTGVLQTYIAFFLYLLFTEVSQIVSYILILISCIFLRFKLTYDMPTPIFFFRSDYWSLVFISQCFFFPGALNNHCHLTVILCIFNKYTFAFFS